MHNRLASAALAAAMACCAASPPASLGEEIIIVPAIGPRVLGFAERTTVAPIPAGQAAAPAEESLMLQPGEVEAKLSDGSAIRLVLKQETYELITPYGKLSIPAGEVRLVELAPRIADDLAAQIGEAVAALGSPQFEIREKGASDLLAIGPKGYPTMLRLAKETKDAEAAARLQEVLDKIRANLPDDQAEPRAWDVVHTSHSKLSGKLEIKMVAAETSQFGSVELKLADVRDLRFHGGGDEIDLSKLQNAPPYLYDMQTQIGKTFTWKITGNARAGTLWGTDTYTLDSALAAAVVHAGVVKDGQTGAVRLKIVESPESFTGSTRNGVSSHNYARYPAAYKIIKLR
jgi:hypothetical protein